MKLFPLLLLSLGTAVLCSSCANYDVMGRLCYTKGSGSACIGADNRGATLDIQFSGK